MSIFLSVAFILAASILLIKIGEIIFTSMIPTIRYGRAWTAAFHKDYIRMGGRAAVIEHLKRRPYKIVINRWIGKYSLTLSNLVYRYFILIFLVAFLQMALVSILSSCLLWAGVILIYLALFIAVVHELIDRLLLGVASNIQLSMYVNIAADIPFESQPYTMSEIAKRCALQLILHLVSLWLGFAAIYRSLVAIHPGHFVHLKNVMDCLYFSLVAMTTTGFGEIYPLSDLAKAAVASEIGMSWSLVVITIFHYGATLSMDLTTEKKET
jgi:hypothetical protein